MAGEGEPNTFLFFSQGIADYITRCKQAIGKFETLVHQIHKNADDISSRLALIEAINLFKYPMPKNEEELPGGSSFFFFQFWDV
jgi:dynein heavy chain